MATETRPGTAEVWDWLAQVPDPEIPVISVTDLGIVRDVAWEDDTLVVTVTPTYSGCPATTIINLDIETALRARGIDKLTLKRRLSPPWTTDWLTAARPRQAPRLRHRPADRRHRRRRPAGRPRQPPRRRQPDDRLPALRLDRDREGQPVRLDPLQGQLPLHRLPRTLRLLQVHLERTPETP